ncbi:MAG: hypothetical protein WCW84_08015 [Sulfurimonas sp.]|jgi:hypothetical protein
MKKSVLVLLGLGVLYAQSTGYPEWFLKENTSTSVPVCVKVNDSLSTARTIALSKAKAELQRGQKVTMESETVLENGRVNDNATTSFKEVIKQNTQGVVSGYSTLDSGIFSIDGVENYCLLYGLR